MISKTNPSLAVTVFYTSNDLPKPLYIYQKVVSVIGPFSSSYKAIVTDPCFLSGIQYNIPLWSEICSFNVRKLVKYTCKA
jgi:hypothetical protein